MVFIFKPSNRYKEIDSVFPITAITDEYIMKKEQNKSIYIHIYQVNPVVILDENDSHLSGYIKQYTELLRSVEEPFEILVQNTKIEVESYLKRREAFINNAIKRDFFLHDAKEVRAYFETNKVYHNRYFIVFGLDTGDDSVIAKQLLTLSQVGIKIQKVVMRENLEKLMYEMINKEIL